ncbi:hypothetical protein NE237_022266 [Protea cynaroides]|uniref:TF-B3 domain-containing protein n=1 Tax=Protea cynaroides TaxID=273540 RepID=A0A9Q0K4A8_9MAGN|nr:hypothetical protein NE237_022266 [Protea cynaroides]
MIMFIQSYMKLTCFCSPTPKRIPRKFIRELRDELADIVVLKVPSGKVWSIGLRKSDGKVWFDKGWQEFAESNSILENYFLVFRYDGHSNFYVTIFDTTACEIEYPCDTMDYEENNPKGGCQIDEEMEEQSCEEIFDVPQNPSKTTAVSRKLMIEELEEQSCDEIFDVPQMPSKTTAVSRKLMIEELEEQSCEEIFDVPQMPSKTTAASRKLMTDEPEEQSCEEIFDVP